MICNNCCEDILEEYAYLVGDDWICEDCMHGFLTLVPTNDEIILGMIEDEAGGR